MTNTTQVNDINATVTSFVNAMGSGVSATQHLAILIHDCIATGDTRAVSGAINRLDRKGDVSGTRVVRQVFASIFVGAKATKSKDKRSTVLSIATDEKGAAKVDAKTLERFNKAVSDKLSIRDALVKRVKGETEAKELDLVKYAEGLVKRIAKDGVTSAALIAAIQAAAAK